MHPVELGVHLSRRARRLLGDTGAVRKDVPNLAKEAAAAARELWRTCQDHQIVLWFDNWYRKRFSTDPRHQDMSMNVSACAVLHIEEVAMFPGHKSVQEVTAFIPIVAAQLSACGE